MFVTPTPVPTESAACQVARLVCSFPRCACARATLGAQSVRRPGCNAGPLGFCGRPQRAGPAQSPPDQDARVHHREVAPAPATSAKYTMPRNTSSGADHFRAVATMMRDVTFPPVTKTGGLHTYKNFVRIQLRHRKLADLHFPWMTGVAALSRMGMSSRELLFAVFALT